MDFASSARAAEDRTRWKGVVVSHLRCPNDHTRLWDRLNYTRAEKIHAHLS